MNRAFDFFELFFSAIFSSGIFIFFAFFYPYHLHYQEQLQLFQFGFGYLIQNLQIPGGTINYLGEFFTQFYYYPVFGAAIIALLLLMVQQLIKKIIFNKIKRSPFILITFIPSLIYSVLLTDNYYYLSGLVGLLIGLSALFIYSLIKNKFARIVSGFFIIFILYYLAGGIYILISISIVVLEIIRKTDRNNSTPIWTWPIILLITILIPLILREYIILGPILQSYVSEYYYQFRIVFPISLVILWGLIPLMIIIVRFLPETYSQIRSLIIVTSLFAFHFAIVWFGLKTFASFEDEKIMEYDHLVRFEKWDEIITISEKNKPKERSSMLALNLALAMKNQLSDKMFVYQQNTDNLFIHYNKHGMLPHLASDIYYHLGFINFAQMDAFESNESSFDAKNSVRVFKRLAETALINGQYKQAEKYLAYLRNTMFYSSWAEKAMSYLYNDKKLEADPDLGEKRRLKPKTEYFSNWNRMDNMLICSLIDNPKNQIAYEYLMAYYLLQKDFDNFLKYFGLMNTFNYPKVPLAFQQALVYVYTLSPQIRESLMSVSIDRKVSEGIQNYASIYKQGNEAAKLLLKNDFGDTYWYYLHFTKLPSDSVQVEGSKHRE